MRRLSVDRLSWRLGLSVAIIVVAALAGALLVAYRVYYVHLLQTVRQHAAIQARLIRLALEHDMLGNDRGLIRKVVSSFTRQASIQRVMVLDRQGNVQISSDPTIGKRHFAFQSPTCQQCHRRSPQDRERTTTLEVDGGTVFRTVEPIPNSPRCHACHDRTHAINGVLIVDVPLQQTLASMERALGTLALATGGIGLLLLGGIGYAFRRLVMRRLLRFESTARAIADGELQRRVPVRGNDALTRVERQFNTMADALGSLLSQLRDQRASLEKVMNSVNDGMVVLDRSRLVVATNEALVRRFGGNSAYLLGRVCCSVFRSCGDGAASDAQCPTLACFASGRVEVTIRTRTGADGAVRQEEVVASPVHAPDGAITHVVEVWRDITDRQSAEARLANTQRLAALGMLASGFSHEVNTPLASIGTCLDAITRLSAKPELTTAQLEQIAEYARVAATQVERCGGITQQFLHLARGKTLAREIVDLSSCVEIVARLAGPTAREAGIEVLVEPSPTPPPAILANSSAVQQVLLNVVLNAVAASAGGQRVVLSFRLHPERTEVLVRDEGQGIAADDLPRVFEPFFSRREKGVGLGLFVSLNFAHGWGGDIRTESGPGIGTTFTVIFPHRPPMVQNGGCAAGAPGTAPPPGGCAAESPGTARPHGGCAAESPGTERPHGGCAAESPGTERPADAQADADHPPR